MPVRPNHRKLCHHGGKHNLVALRPIRYIAAQKSPALRWSGLSTVSNSKSARREPRSGHLSTHSHNRKHPELDLMYVGEPINPGISDGNGSLAVVEIYRNTLVHDARVALGIPHSLNEARC